MTTNWVAYNNRSACPHSSGGWKSEAKVSAGSVPSEALRERQGECSSLSRSGDLLAALGVPLLLEASRRRSRLCPHRHAVPLLCVSASRCPSSYKDTIACIKGHPTPGHLQRPCGHIHGCLRLRLFHSFSGDPVQPTTRGNSDVQAGTSAGSEMSPPPQCAESVDGEGSWAGEYE